MTKANLLESAKKIAESVKSWADFSNALFNPVDGLISQAYPTRAERLAYSKTDEYKAIRELVLETITRTGLIEGATPNPCFGCDQPAANCEGCEHE
jgi:hypothetical protein